MPTLEDLLKNYGQIPDLSSFKKPLFVGPHPDDIEFGCGGLVSKFKELGASVTYVIATDGGAGTTDPSITPEMMANTRKQEVLDAAAFMGVKNVEFLGLEDGGDYDVTEVIRRLAPVVLKYCPDVIFAPDSHLKTECHADHLKVGEGVRRLMQIAPHPESLRRHHVNVDGFSEFPGNMTLALFFTDDANAKVEITEKNFGEKMQSLMLHTSQMQSSETELLMMYFKMKAEKLGQGTDTGLAEDYQVILPIMQHVYSEGIHL